MGVIQNVSRRLVEAAEQLTGREVVESGTSSLVESYQSDNRILRRTLDYVGFKLFNFQTGHPKEMKPQARRLTAQKALTAFAEDPMAGEYVDLYVSFVFGRGVPRPQAFDDEVQAHLDEVWDDQANQRIITKFAKLVEKGIDFNIQSNILFLLFDDGEDGMVRLSLLTFDDVEGVKRHPRDRYRILYYKVVERPPAQMDWSRGVEVETQPMGLPKLVYYEAADAFDETNPVMQKQDEGVPDGQLRPPESLLRPGKVLHLATNKTSEDAFGIPVMRRLLRWWTAHNEVLESHVDRMKAMAQVYMKATAKGTERDLQNLAQMTTGRASTFGAAQTPEGTPAVPAPPRGPGVLGQNESLNFEPFKIDSGAADVAQSVPQLRAQFSGPWPTTYYGQEATALAGAQSMELPVLKFVEREQELWADGVLRPLADAAIERAIDTGKISEWRDPTDEEQARIAAARAANDEPDGLEVNEQGQVKRDLGYDLSLPSPLKRAMLDIVSAAIEVATAVDPNGDLPDLSRWLFGYTLAEAFDVQDPQRIVDQVLPRDLAREQAAAAVDESSTPEDPNMPTDGSVGPDGLRHPAGNPYGAPRKSPQPEKRPVTEAPHGRAHRRRAPRGRARAVRAAFDEDVSRVALEHLHALGGTSTNGHP